MLSHRHKEDLDYINRLPTEILDLIFQDVAAVSTEVNEYTAVDEYTEVDEYIPTRALFPFNVASVCRSWLAILKSKPQFWHHFIIDVAGPQEMSVACPWHVRASVARTGQCPCCPWHAQANVRARPCAVRARPCVKV